MKPIILRAFAILLGAAAAAASAQQPATLRGSEAATPDEAPQERAYVGGRPGKQKLVARTFKGQPPLIPHATDKYQDITAEENACLECHITDKLQGRKMPRVGASHLVPGQVDADGNPVLLMSRWQCNTCHVPQVDAKPLVENAFRGLPARR